MKVKSVLIVGGGSSGWMTAAALVKQTPNIKVTLVESPNISTIGVGESTIGHINTYLHAIGLKDEDWMEQCNATYKTSIKFIDFREKKENPVTFHYPFGILDYTDKPGGPTEWFKWKSYEPNLDPQTFAEFYHDSVLMTDAVKMTKNQNGELRGFNFDYDTAYHMDATAFGLYLRDSICLPSGMTHILDDVTEVLKDENGFVSGIATKSSKTLTADLYVDCTGFKSMLLEEAMGVPFIPFHDTLLNDSAIATTIPYIDKEKEMECVTSCTGIDAGWVWNIPLYHRIGTGYVYSSKFATKEEAEEQFRKHLASNRMICPDAERAEQATFKHIKIKHGAHARGWEKNVVAVGLASGFIEPLESTGLMLTHESIMKMLDVLQVRNGLITKFDIDSFNFAVRDQITGFKDFISLHYALSMRNDTPYWKHITEEMCFSPEMVEWKPRLRNAYAELANRNFNSREYDHNMGGIIYIAAGHGYNPLNTRVIEDSRERFGVNKYNTWEESKDLWLKHKSEVMEAIKKMPTHYQFLKQNIFNGKE